MSKRTRGRARHGMRAARAAHAGGAGMYVWGELAAHAPRHVSLGASSAAYCLILIYSARSPESPRIPGQVDPRTLRRRRASGRGHRQPGRGARDRRAPGRPRASSRRRSTPAAAGKGGGVKLAKDPDEAHALAKAHPRHDARHAADRAGRTASSRRSSSRRRSTSTASSTSASRSTARRGMPVDDGRRRSGGMEIEEVAAKDPRRSSREGVDPSLGMFPFQARKLALRARPLGREPSRKGVAFMQALFRAYVETDASASRRSIRSSSRSQGDVLALDAKMTFDDNALFRHPDIKEMRDLSEEDPLEVEASKFGLNYIKLDGNVGCMVNGAGLAMAHDGHHQARRRRAGQLPRRRRRRQRRAGQERVPDHPFRQERAGPS